MEPTDKQKITDAFILSGVPFVFDGKDISICADANDADRRIEFCFNDEEQFTNLY